MRVSDITSFLEQMAPPSLQESYDNSGLLVGDSEMEIEAVLVSLDVTEDVIDEAISKGAGLIISHHPIVFGGLKRLTGKNYVERCVIKAIHNNIALYAIHTNLDNVAHGVNKKISDKLGLRDTRVLTPKHGLLRKLVTYVPKGHVEKVLAALFRAGAGQLGDYDECSFRSEGLGTFRGSESTDPFVGRPGVRHQEVEEKVEVILPSYVKGSVLKALFSAHPYEEVAWDLLITENHHPNIGSGMIGELPSASPLNEFLLNVKNTFGGVVRHTREIHQKVSKIAVCGGSGSFLLKDAIGAGADVFLTADFKYHQFFDADHKIVIADIGHFESEQFTIELISDAIREKFTNFATFQTTVETNPILYL